MATLDRLLLRDKRFNTPLRKQYSDLDKPNSYQTSVMISQTPCHDQPTPSTASLTYRRETRQVERDVINSLAINLEQRYFNEQPTLKPSFENQNIGNIKKTANDIKLSVVLAVVLAILVVLVLSSQKGTKKQNQKVDMTELQQRQQTNKFINTDELVSKEIEKTIDFIRIGGPVKIADLSASIIHRHSEDIYDQFIKKIRNSPIFILDRTSLNLTEDWWNHQL